MFDVHSASANRTYKVKSAHVGKLLGSIRPRTQPGGRLDFSQAIASSLLEKAFALYPLFTAIAAMYATMSNFVGLTIAMRIPDSRPRLAPTRACYMVATM